MYQKPNEGFRAEVTAEALRILRRNKFECLCGKVLKRTEISDHAHDCLDLRAEAASNI